MIEFLALQVIMGNVTVDQVPARYREAVAVRVAELQKPVAELQSIAEV